MSPYPAIYSHHGTFLRAATGTFCSSVDSNIAPVWVAMVVQWVHYVPTGLPVACTVHIAPVGSSVTPLTLLSGPVTVERYVELWKYTFQNIAIHVKWILHQIMVIYDRFGATGTVCGGGGRQREVHMMV